MPKLHTRDEYIKHVIPYRMKAVAVFNLALGYVMAWDAPRKMEIYFDGKLAIQGLSTAFTNPVIEAGVMHCRALLEFIGLRSDPKDPDKLVPRRDKRKDDLVMEDFAGANGSLSPVSVTAAIAAYTGSPDEAEKALAVVIRCANKGIAHSTYGHMVESDNFAHFEIASRGVPMLLVNHFYIPLGVRPPDYELTNIKRGD